MQRLHRRIGIGGILAVLAASLVLLFVMAPAAVARTRSGVTMPDRIDVGGKTLVLNGMGVREATVLNVDVYVAGLYLEDKSSDANAILRSREQKRIVLHFVRDVEREDINEAFDEGFEKNARKALPAIRGRVATLRGYMTDMGEGDKLVFTYTAQKGVQPRVKGAVKPPIQGDDFARAFFALWLGPHPPNSGLKTGLLGR